MCFDPLLLKHAASYHFKALAALGLEGRKTPKLERAFCSAASLADAHSTCLRILRYQVKAISRVSCLEVTTDLVMAPCVFSSVTDLGEKTLWW